MATLASPMILGTPESRRNDLAKALRLNRYIKQVPHPKQAAFLLLPHREAFYGGAGSGGKSSALLMAALQWVDIPGYAAIIFRRTYPDLSKPGAIMDRAYSWLKDTDAHWDGQKHTWSFPTKAEPSRVVFSHMESENAKYDHQGAEYQAAFFDELTAFSETQYRYIFTRLRRLKGSDVPIRMRSASMPGGIGHQWVKQRFIVEGRRYGRPFIPAKIADNPSMDQEEYHQSLSHVDAVTRQQIEDGDWDVVAEGTMFKRQWFPIVRDWPRDGRAIRMWDLASTEMKPGKDPDYLAGGLVVHKHGQYWVVDLVHERLSPRGVEDTIKQTASLDGRDVEIWIEQEPGASSKLVIDHYQRSVLRGYSVQALHVDKNKAVRAKPAASAAEAGNIFLVEGPWNSAFLDELALVFQGPHDDIADVLSGAINVFMPEAEGKRAGAWGR